MTAPAKVVECMDCATLPELAEVRGRAGLIAGVDYRPVKPRPIAPDSTPRRPRCATHLRRHRGAVRQAESDKRSRKRSGLDDDLKAAVIAEQGGLCPCGAPLVPRGTRKRKRLNPQADHDHVKAAEHDHPDDVACPECMRGYLCPHTNRDIIGYLARIGRSNDTTRSDAEVAKALRAIADYLDDPPAQRVRRRLAAEAQLATPEGVSDWFLGISDATPVDLLGELERSLS